MEEKMRVLHYFHQANGRGHIQRTLALAGQVALDLPEVTQLLVTDTPQPRGVTLPPKLDFIKLPSTDPSSTGGFHDPSLLLPPGVTEVLRESLILNAIKHFRPDVILMEISEGAQREIHYMRNYLQQNQIETKFVIGVGDIETAVMMIREILVPRSGHTYFLSSEADYSEEVQSYSNASGHNYFNVCANKRPVPTA